MFAVTSWRSHLARESVFVRNVQCSVEHLYRFLLRSPALQLCQRSCRCGEAERAVEMFQVSVHLHELRSEYYVTVLSAGFNSFFKCALSVKREVQSLRVFIKA